MPDHHVPGLVKSLFQQQFEYTQMVPGCAGQLGRDKTGLITNKLYLVPDVEVNPDPLFIAAGLDQPVVQQPVHFKKVAQFPVPQFLVVLGLGQLPDSMSEPVQNVGKLFPVNVSGRTLEPFGFQDFPDFEQVVEFLVGKLDDPKTAAGPGFDQPSLWSLARA